MIRHKYEPSPITPGRCGASELAPGTYGHFICCGKPETAETHKEAPRPEFTLSQIVAIREALATVIDDGDPAIDSTYIKPQWVFCDSDAPEQIDRRMRFTDAVQEILTRKARRTQIETEKNERLLALMP